MSDLRIITETREELASIGIESRVSPNVCRDCRFRVPFRGTSHSSSPSVHDECLVNGNASCWRANPHGECERFEPWRTPAIRSVATGTIVPLASLALSVIAIVLAVIL